MQPMLAKPATSVDSAIERIIAALTWPLVEGGASTEGRSVEVWAAAEFKYDGQRAQLHFSHDGKVSLFSRKSDDITAKYPDVVVAATRSAMELHMPQPCPVRLPHNRSWSA